MRTKQWVQRTAWSGLFLMSVFVAMQVEARGGGGEVEAGVEAEGAAAAAFPGAVVPVAGASAGRRWGRRRGWFFSERCCQ